MALETAGDYITAARVILNDGDSGRYTNDTLLLGLILGMSEIYSLRPDLLLDVTIPSSLANATAIALDARYRSALLDYLCGYAEKQDVEAADTARSAMYMALFRSKLLGSNG